MTTIRILFVASNPTDTSPLRLTEEMREIELKLLASSQRDSFQIRAAWAVRADDLLRELDEFRPHVLHFSGHGSTTGEIVLESAQGEGQSPTTSALTAAIGVFAPPLQVVVLNACYSGRQAEALAEVCDAVIGMSDAIDDHAAIVFAASLYRALGSGRSVDEALGQGRVALQLEGLPGHETPELRLRDGVDGRRLRLVGRGSTAGALRRARDLEVPERLRNLLNAGAELLDIGPYSRDDSGLLFVELALRHSAMRYVIEIDRDLGVDAAARAVAERLLGEPKAEAYDWSFVRNDETLPAWHSLAMAGLSNGDRVLLVGNHRRPEWAPSA